MQATLNISLPPALKRWLEEQIAHGGYASPGEYIRQLLRAEQKRQARPGVEEKLQEALDSGEPRAVTATTWRGSQKRVEARLKATSRKRRADGKNR